MVPPLDLAPHTSDLYYYDERGVELLISMRPQKRHYCIQGHRSPFGMQCRKGV